jgi:hypothetical protein
MSRHQSSKQDRVNVLNQSFEMWEQKYRNKIYVYQGTKKRLNWENAYYQSLQNHLCSSMLSRTVVVKYTSVYFYLVFCMDVELSFSP